MRSFDIPIFYRSPIISQVKQIRMARDPRRKDLTPTVLDFGPVRFKIARHFGFCFGVENAIEIAYKTLEENADKRVFLLSEMIHNPHVNLDLNERGVQFIMNTDGTQRVAWDDITTDDVVIVPAFGTTLEIESVMKARGIDPYTFDTTCPFVEKVWNKTEDLGERGCTVVVHGKRTHEETRATFSHSRSHTPTIVVQDMAETETLAGMITGAISIERFEDMFAAQSSEGFDPLKDLTRIGVVNQTTMLASDTQAIADRLKQAMIERYGADAVADHFVDTRDTLCYATNENQNATLRLIEEDADFAIVVGGYNSSNTTHLVELCEHVLPTYFIKDADEIESETAINHFDIKTSKRLQTDNWLDLSGIEPVDIVLTSGASCPDALVDDVIQKVVSFFSNALTADEALAGVS